MENKPTPNKVIITPQGSLGLLALGAVGLREWRKVRDAHKEKENGEKSR